MEKLLEMVRYDSKGLVPAVVQDASNKDVLMVGYMNEEALRQTLETGRVTFWSRSRKRIWVKGETSGHTQTVKEIYVDCDEDCLVIMAEQVGGACHKGYRTCFYRKLKPDGSVHIVQQLVFDPHEAY